MRRLWMLAVAATLLPACMHSQRHGRADSVQNYVNRHSEPNPILSLRLEASRKWLYLHQSDMKSMKVSTVSVHDSTTGVIHTYEGILLKDLVPGGNASDHFEVFRTTRFTDKRALTSDNLNAGEDALVAYQVDGKRVSGGRGYSFVATRRTGEQEVVANLAYIRVVPERQKRP